METLKANTPIFTYMVFEKNPDNEKIKGFFSSYDKADKYAKKLYDNEINYYNYDTTYNNIDSWSYEVIIPADGGWAVFETWFYVIEIEAEVDEPCEIEI